jgi:pyroglutamyl-peptidase
MTVKVLVTAFDVFGKYETNSSFECVRAYVCSNKKIHIIKQILPVEFKKSSLIIKDLIQCSNPDLIILTGQSSVSDKICIERAALNIADTIMPDNAGYKPVDEPVVSYGPAAFFSTLPIKKINHNILKFGEWSQISNSAGTYVCNTLMYSALHYLHEQKLSIPCGFIHIPVINSTNLDINMILKCFDVIIDTSLNSF